MTDAGKERPAPAMVELSEDELALIRTALRLLESTLGREEAEELGQVQQILRKLGLDASVP